MQASELFADGHHGGFHHFSDKEEDGDERAGWLLAPFGRARAVCCGQQRRRPKEAPPLWRSTPLSSAAWYCLTKFTHTSIGFTAGTFCTWMSAQVLWKYQRWCCYLKNLLTISCVAFNRLPFIPAIRIFYKFKIFLAHQGRVCNKCIILRCFDGFYMWSLNLNHYLIIWDPKVFMAFLSKVFSF